MSGLFEVSEFLINATGIQAKISAQERKSQSYSAHIYLPKPECIFFYS